MHPTKPPQDLLFVDVETTGLDPLKHELIEIAAIRTTFDGLHIKESFEAKLRPQHLERAEPKALEVNGYNEVEWAPERCIAPESVVKTLASMAANAVLVGHNISFDENFLVALYTSQGLPSPFGYHKVDTVALAWPFFVNGTLSGLNLSKLCAYLGVPTIPNHRAASDVSACRKAYLLLMEGYATLKK